MIHRMVPDVVPPQCHTLPPTMEDDQDPAEQFKKMVAPPGHRLGVRL